MKRALLALTFLSLTNLYANNLVDTLPIQDVLSGVHEISTNLAYDRFTDATNSTLKLIPLVDDWLKQATESHPSYSFAQQIKTGLMQLSNASEEKAYRVAFSVVSEGTVNLLRADLELRKSWQLHFCPHVEGHYAYWVQPLNEKRMNPYFGQAMFGCGVKKPW